MQRSRVERSSRLRRARRFQQQAASAPPTAPMSPSEEVRGVIWTVKHRAIQSGPEGGWAHSASSSRCWTAITGSARNMMRKPNSGCASKRPPGA